LQRFDILLRNAHVAELAKAGIHPVNHFALLQHPVHHGARGSHALQRRGCQPDFLAADGQTFQHFQSQ
jgi:hypothetical protein